MREKREEVVRGLSEDECEKAKIQQDVRTVTQLKLLLMLTHVPTIGLAVNTCLHL